MHRLWALLGVLAAGAGLLSSCAGVRPSIVGCRGFVVIRPAPLLDASREGAGVVHHLQRGDVLAFRASGGELTCEPWHHGLYWRVVTVRTEETTTKRLAGWVHHSDVARVDFLSQPPPMPLDIGALIAAARRWIEEHPEPTSTQGRVP